MIRHKYATPVYEYAVCLRPDPGLAAVLSPVQEKLCCIRAASAGPIRLVRGQSVVLR